MNNQTSFSIFCTGAGFRFLVRTHDRERQERLLKARRWGQTVIERHVKVRAQCTPDDPVCVECSEKRRGFEVYVDAGRENGGSGAAGTGFDIGSGTLSKMGIALSALRPVAKRCIYKLSVEERGIHAASARDGFRGVELTMGVQTAFELSGPAHRQARGLRPPPRGSPKLRLRKC